MTGCAIVAIPDEYSPVWKVSSEKVPHLTLLYLGELADDVDQAAMALFVQHVVETSLHPFEMSVARRGVLGDDEADVLFFDKNRGSCSKLEAFRSYLLSDPQINKAYQAAFQYPQWTPHLTLGYPEAPAKTVDRDRDHLDWVFFNKVAIWFGDFEGPEFELEHDNSDPMSAQGEMAMAEPIDTFLEHFGVKGMKWGVRRDGGAASVNTSTERVTVNAPRSKTRVTQLKKKKYERQNADTAVTIVQRPGQRLATKGGSNREAHEDAVKAAENKRIARSSSTDALSTKELQEMVSRMNLEQQYAKLTAPQKTIGQKVVDNLLGTGGQVWNEQSKKVANEQAGKFLVKKGLVTTKANNNGNNNNKS